MTPPNHLARLEAFKSGTAPYGQLPPAPTPQEAARAEQARLKAERTTSIAEHKASTKSLKAAAKALEWVYGAPPGSEAVKASVRGAKARRAGGMPALEALEQCPEECALMDVIEAVLTMRGAT